MHAIVEDDTSAAISARGTCPASVVTWKLAPWPHERAVARQAVAGGANRPLADRPKRNNGTEYNE